MPAPLVELASLDLSRTVHPKEEVYEILRHRGTFALVDGILHFDPTQELIVGFKDIRLDDWWAKDHIPGRPIFPGVLMIEAATQIGCFDYFKRRPNIPLAFVGFTGIDNTKFRAPVEPPSRMVFVGKGVRSRTVGGRVLFTYVFQGFVAEKLVFEADVTGMQF